MNRRGPNVGFYRVKVELIYKHIEASSPDEAERLAKEWCPYADCQPDEMIATATEEPHQFRPFTTRDGGLACADCNACQNHVIHGIQTEDQPSSINREED